jgi:hypothetical protein
MLFTESQQPGPVSPEMFFQQASEDSRFLLFYQLSRINLGLRVLILMLVHRCCGGGNPTGLIFFLGN